MKPGMRAISTFREQDDDMLALEYAREALKNGLLLEEKFGTNPYKFGMSVQRTAIRALLP